MDSLLAIFALLLLGWFWLDSLRARELAAGICRAACDERDFQFLDQAVALQRLVVARTPHGLRLRRVFRFDFREGVGRRSGYVILRGIDLEASSASGYRTSPRTPDERPTSGYLTTFRLGRTRGGVGGSGSGSAASPSASPSTSSSGKSMPRPFSRA